MLRIIPKGELNYYINGFNKATIDRAYENMIKYLIELYKQRQSHTFLEKKITKQYPEPPFNEIGHHLIQRYFQPLIKEDNPSAKNKDKSKNKQVKTKNIFLN